tara:strand:+ start:17955 stop:19484 length:1530 start_codon:yes stop_codon:yes gene_type:complete
MKVDTYYFFETKFLTNWKKKYITFKNNDKDILTIGRTYSGVYNRIDGNYIQLKQQGNEFQLSRDKFGSIPVYYSIKYNLISTNINEIVSLIKRTFASEGLSEYLDSAYTSFGSTIYSEITVLQPDEILVIKAKSICARKIETYYPNLDNSFDIERLEEVIIHSLDNLLNISQGKLVLNLSGGNDSSLLMCLLNKIGCGEIITNTYYHEDWRNDFDDWYWAEKISKIYCTNHKLIKINNETFCSSNMELTKKSKNIFHTYATAFYKQNLSISDFCNPEDPIVNGSGPDETMIGTEKLSIKELLNMNKFSNHEFLEYILNAKDYSKVDAQILDDIVNGNEKKYSEFRIQGAKNIMDGGSFVEFQRKFHSQTILQDHIKSISEVASTIQRPIFFPFLTNDIFDIVFGTSFEELNKNETYKYAIKKILRKYLPDEIVDRKKIGFQSPSRKYFVENVGLGRELRNLIETKSNILNMAKSREIIQERISGNLSLTKRYDFLEWGIYNILNLEQRI